MVTNIYLYKQGSESGKKLAAALGVRRIRHGQSRYKGRPEKKVINWGSSELPPEVLKSTVINKPDRVKNASNKLKFFQMMPQDIVVPWTTDFNQAVEWTRDSDVCARTILSGHSAAGLVMMKKGQPDTFVQAPLFTKYIKKTDEFRVHVKDGAVIDVQRKALNREMLGDREPDWQVRNLANGFVYARNDIVIPEGVESIAVRAVEACGLDFGAVDVIYNQRDRRAYVLEINTAPGLSGTTLEKYAQAFGVI